MRDVCVSINLDGRPSFPEKYVSTVPPESRRMEPPQPMKTAAPSSNLKSRHEGMFDAAACPSALW